MNANVPFFFDHIGGSSGQTSISSLLQTELPGIIAQHYNGSPQQKLSNDCLLVEIGNFLVSVLEITSDLAQSLVMGHHIRDQTVDRRSMLEQEPDLHTIDYLDDKNEALR